MSPFARFCVVGAIGFAVDAGLLTALTRAGGADPYAARVASFLAAATATWWLNRRFTFAVGHAPSGGEWARYVALMVLGAAINYGTYALLISIWEVARAHLWIGVAAGSVAGLGVNFLTSRRLLGRAPAPAPQPPVPPLPPAGPVVDFTCNLCGHFNRGVPLAQAENRECQSCAKCMSSLRMRSLMYLLSLELFGRPLTVPEFPADKSIAGLGMSDWEGYANALAGKFSYTNTFYHAEPRLDIARVAPELLGRHRFLISSDVFEHIPLFELDAAFRNCRGLLRDDGFLLFTVPFNKEGETEEHFPSLRDFRIEERDGRRVLRNRLADGGEETFENLVFHGGEGMTLEMRMFSEPDLRRRLAAAGFRSVEVRHEHFPEYGILWPMDWAVPMIARA